LKSRATCRQLDTRVSKPCRELFVWAIHVIVILLTTNQPYKHRPKIFNNDSPLASAVLDRLVHHAETVISDGKSCRMKDQIDTP
jgi:hypothetical protein